MRIPYGFDLTPTGSLESKENEAETVRMIFGYYPRWGQFGKGCRYAVQKEDSLSDRESKMDTCGG